MRSVRLLCVRDSPFLPFPLSHIFSSSSVDPIHELQVPVHGLKFLSTEPSSCQEKLFQSSLLRVTFAVMRTCSSMGCNSHHLLQCVCSTGPWFLSGEPAPAWAVQGHTSGQGSSAPAWALQGPSFFQKSLLQCGLSTVPPGHILVPAWGPGGAIAWVSLMAFCLPRPQASLCSGTCGTFPAPALPLVPHSFPVTPHQLSFALCQGLSEVSSARPSPRELLREPTGTGWNRPCAAQVAAGLSHTAPAAALVPVPCRGRSQEPASNPARHNTFPARCHGLGRASSASGQDWAEHREHVQDTAKPWAPWHHSWGKSNTAGTSSQRKPGTDTNPVTESLTRSSCTRWTFSSLKFRALLQLSTYLHGLPGHEWFSDWSY